MDIAKRIDILTQMRNNIFDCKKDILDALYTDLGKSKFESYMCELGIVLDELNYTIKNIKQWSKPKKVRTPLKLLGSKSYIYPKPYGSVLIISPWNYPFMLTLVPLISALAAGNTVTIKMSEYALATCNVVSKILQNLDAITLVEPIESVGQKLLEQKWDYIFFTGSKRVGELVAQAASSTLTPITLELGGKCPCIILPSANLALSAKKIAWGKFINAGQTCVAPDYIIIGNKQKNEFVHQLKKYIQQFYGDSPIDNDFYPKIINQSHYQRILALIDGNILLGGEFNAQNQKINPTLLDAKPNGRCMQEEIFGPVLPILTLPDQSTLELTKSIIQFVNSKDIPLALYVFGNQKESLQLLSQMPSGGACVNDILIHLANHNLPFGGLGQSGLGNYHGKFGFATFTHFQSILLSNKSKDYNFRYPPYNKKQKTLQLLRYLSKDKQND